jgi:hypothetical protein
MRRMLFSTILLPGAVQHVELAHPFWRFSHCGVTAIRTSLHGAEGDELAAADLPLDRNVVELRDHFPAVAGTALAFFDVAYDLKGKRHPYQYGYLYQEAPGATPIHYPLDVTMGLTDAINYMPNYGYFPLGPLPDWAGIRLYLGNPCERATIEPRLRLVTSRGVRRRTVSLPPLGHRCLDLEPAAAGETLEYLTLHSDTKPVCYVAGVDRRSGALTFLEHLMQTFRLDSDE